MKTSAVSPPPIFPASFKFIYGLFNVHKPPLPSSPFAFSLSQHQVFPNQSAYILHQFAMVTGTLRQYWPEHL